jgi:hypothetical protein
MLRLECSEMCKLDLSTMLIALLTQTELEKLYLLMLTHTPNISGNYPH